jgi:hypothetical protein
LLIKRKSLKPLMHKDFKLPKWMIPTGLEPATSTLSKPIIVFPIISQNVRNPTRIKGCGRFDIQ